MLFKIVNYQILKIRKKLDNITLSPYNNSIVIMRNQMQKSLIVFLVLVFQVFYVKDASFCMHANIQNVQVVPPVNITAVPISELHTLAGQAPNFFSHCRVWCDVAGQEGAADLLVPNATLVHSYNGLVGIPFGLLFSARIIDPVRVGQICAFLGIQPAAVPGDFSFTIARTSLMSNIPSNDDPLQPLAMRFPWEYTEQYLANPGNCNAEYNVTANVALIDTNGMVNPNVSGGYSMHGTQPGCLTVSPDNGHLNIDPTKSTAVISSATWANGPIAGQTRLSVILLLNEEDADALYDALNPFATKPINTYGDLFNKLPSGLMGAQNGILGNILRD